MNALLEASEGRAGTLVLVTGSGRSGTSTAAGTLKKLGLHIPQPEIPANDANPRGYFEPRWAVNFHKRVLSHAGVRTLDARPEAADLMIRSTDNPDFRDQLREWLADQAGLADQIVVKDPRAFWATNLWLDAADAARLSPRFLTMLRHPTEVVASRDMHYLKNAGDAKRRVRETANIGGWVNVALINERASRGVQRAFLHYTDLITDWRSAMRQTGEILDLAYDDDLEPDHRNAVDDFIDSNLRRAQVSWTDLDVPSDLRDIAEAVWANLDRLCKDPADAAAMESNDRLAVEYRDMHGYAVALTQDYMNHRIDQVRAQVRRRTLREVRAQAAAATPASVRQRVVRRLRRLRRP